MTDEQYNKNEYSMSYSANLVKKYDHDRFLSVLFAPPDRREALLTLYAFNHELAKVRETVSEPLIGRMRMQFWRDAVLQAGEGNPPKHPVAEPLADVMAKFQLSHHELAKIIEFREWDMDDLPPPSLKSLAQYAEGTSSALMALASQILRADVDPEILRDAGVAHALIGLALSIPFQAATGRVTLPLDLCEVAGLDPAQPQQWPDHPNVKSITDPMMDEAGLRLERVRKDKYSSRAMPALLPLSAAARYLHRLQKADGDPYALIGKPYSGLTPAYLFWRKLLRRP